MRATALDRRPLWELALLGVAVLGSMGVHSALAVGVSTFEVPESTAPVWVEMVVDIQAPEPTPAPVVEEPEPTPEPTPEVQPEPTPEPTPEVVEFEEIPEEVPVEEPPPERKVRRMTQGLSSDSFQEGAGTGLQVRHGTTTSIKATDDPMGLDEEDGFTTVPYTSVTTAPSIRKKPMLTIPSEIIDLEIEGRVEVELTIGTAGDVVAVQVVKGLHPAADASCAADLRKTRWKPGSRDGTPVIVTGVPWSCRYQMVID